MRQAFTQRSTRNGLVTSCSYIDLGAIAFGAGAIAGSIWCANSFRNRTNNRWANVAVRARVDRLTLGIAVIGLVVGVLHLLRGTGIVFSQPVTVSADSQPSHGQASAGVSLKSAATKGTSSTTPTSTRAGSSLKIRSQRELRRLRPWRKSAARRMQATW